MADATVRLSQDEMPVKLLGAARSEVIQSATVAVTVLGGDGGSRVPSVRNASKTGGLPEKV